MLIPGTTVEAYQGRIPNHYTLYHIHESNKQNGVKIRKHNLHVKKALIGKNNNTGIFVVNDSLPLQFYSYTGIKLLQMGASTQDCFPIQFSNSFLPLSGAFLYNPNAEATK